jgi:hypothetical protein
MSTQHTRELWQWDSNVWDYDPDNEAPWLVTDAYAVGIEKHLDQGVVLRGVIKCRSKDDAHLIAAAPYLLNAACLGHADSPGLPAGDLLAAANVLRNNGHVELATRLEQKHAAECEAIAKATGEN